MEKHDKSIGRILGEIGCQFRSNIENHIKDYRLQKNDDVEWLLEPLDEISHPSDYVLDAFQITTRWESIYHLYFHLKGANSIYRPFDKPIERSHEKQKEGDTISFDMKWREEEPRPNPFVKSMIIKDDLNPLASKAIPTIWEDLVVSFTTVGIWQAVLLNEIPALFPKGWHADYLRKIYVFSHDDMQSIYDHCKTIVDDFSDYDDGDNAVATFFYWNDWSGFCKMIIPVEKHGNSVKIGKQEHETLVEYDCRIVY